MFLSGMVNCLAERCFYVLDCDSASLTGSCWEMDSLTGGCVTVCNGLPVAGSEQTWSYYRRAAKSAQGIMAQKNVYSNSKTFTRVQLWVLMRSLDILMQFNTS